MTLLQRPVSDEAFSIAAMHSDRARQFVTRLGWNLVVDKYGWEYDEYDDGRSEIFLVSSDAMHLASCRLRAAKYGSMIEDHFSEVFPNGSAMVASNRNNFYEISRFVTSPDLCRQRRETALDKLVQQLHRAMATKPVGSRFLAVTFRSGLRLIARRGIHCACLDEAYLADKRICLIEVRASGPLGPDS